MTMRRLLLAGLALAIPTLPAAAQTCTSTISDLSFGSVDTLAGSAVSSTATVDISCSGIGLAGVRVCPYLGDGTGGRDASNRYLDGASDELAYQLYTDAGHTSVWGSATLGFGSFPTVDFSGNLLGTATGNATLTIYGLIPAGQDPVPPDSYISQFTAAHTEFQYGINLLGLVSCSGIQLLTSTINPTFTVSALVEKNCSVTASDINFGTHGVLAASVTATGSIGVECTPETAYSVSLNNGLTGTGPAARLMTKGAESVSYGLYQDAGHSQVWGSDPGEAIAGTGTGEPQTLDVHGLVPAQTTPSPGLYQDTVVATVTY